MDPGAELQLLERQILNQDPRWTSRVVDRRRRAPRQERKTMTVLVVEVVPAGARIPRTSSATPGRRWTGSDRSWSGPTGGRSSSSPTPSSAMFGAPRAHEDDALRAVRTALELLDGDDSTGLQLRGGIETGEALVTIDGDEVAITGQVLGAASRLQATAPVGSIVVGPSTHRATEDAIDYRATDGDAWAPPSPAARGRAARDRAAFVGRADELGQLEGIFRRARDGRSVQLVTIIAEPGGGKSRLVRELHGRLDAATERAANAGPDAAAGATMAAGALPAVRQWR